MIVDWCNTIIVSYKDCMFSSCFSESRLAVPLTADAYTTGKSNCSSFASNSINNLKLHLLPLGLADGLSILFTTTTGFKSCSNAF